MEVKKYIPFVVKANPKTTGSTRERSSKTMPKTKLEAKGLSQENKKKLYIIHAKGFVETCIKYFRAMELRPSGNLLRRCFNITMSMGLRPCFTVIITMTIRNCSADNNNHDYN